MKKVVMYTLSTCPWCKKTKQYFKDKKVAFTCIDYDLAAAGEQQRIMAEMEGYGSEVAFPFVIIGNDAVVGYSPERYAELLSIA